MYISLISFPKNCLMIVGGCSCDKKKDFNGINISMNLVIPGNIESQRVLLSERSFLYSTSENSQYPFSCSVLTV